MLSNTALLGLVAIASLTTAAPTRNWHAAQPPAAQRNYGNAAYSAPSGAASYSHALPFPTEVSPDGDNFRFPLSNAFPTPNAQAGTLAIEQAAGGTLPIAAANAPAGSPPQADSCTSLQLIATNELFEVAFFTSLLTNVTERVPGFDTSSWERKSLIEILEAVQAQEELHALNANAALTKFCGGAIQPCEYSFPTADLNSAIALAATFTDVVLGTLGDVQAQFATSGDDGLIRGIASVIGQEGEQNGFYRLFQGKRPSAQPFLTASARDFAFSALNQNFIVPGSCPSSNPAVNLTVFAPLALLSTPCAEDSTLTFSFKRGPGNTNSSLDDLQLVYINGQNAPVVESLTNLQYPDSDTVQFDAVFPQATDLMFGLTIAAVTSVGNFSSVDDVAAATLFGPALIEVD